MNKRGNGKAENKVLLGLNVTIEDVWGDLLPPASDIELVRRQSETSTM